MMFEVITPYFQDALYSALATLGFAMLFNVPRHCLKFTVLIGALGHVIRYDYVLRGGSPILGAFWASLFIGFCGIYLSRKRKRPSPIFTYPAIIPLVPGVSAYKTMLGILKITFKSNPSPEIVIETLKHGMTTMFVFLAIAVGISLTAANFGLSSRRDPQL